MLSNVELRARLREVSVVHFVSKSQSGIGWSGSGVGVVKVSEPTNESLIFEESGYWQQDSGQKLRFTNTFRWTLVEERLRLEHLRFGANHPVFLFEMQSDADGVWREISPHPCRDDCYRATLKIESERIFVSWLVRGPKRNEVIDYIYT